MSDETDAERDLRRELDLAAAGIDFWYQACKALVVQLIEDQLPVGKVRRVLAQVERQSVGGYEELSRLEVYSLARDMLRRLRDLRSEQDDAARASNDDDDDSETLPEEPP